METFSSGSLAFPRSQTKEAFVNRGDLRLPALPDSQPAWFPRFPLRASIRGKAKLPPFFGGLGVPGGSQARGKGSSRAGAELRPSEGDRGRYARHLRCRGQERKLSAKPVPPIPYQRPRGRVESGGNSGPRARAPARAPFKLRFCTSRPAPRRLEPARAAQPIRAALPPGARQWRRVFLGRARDKLPLPPPPPHALACVCGLGSLRAPGLAALAHQSCARGFCGGADLGFVSEFCAVLAALLPVRDFPRGGGRSLRDQ